MEFNFKQSANSILDHEFKGKSPGYDALEVDRFLDEIVSDYIAFEQAMARKEKAFSELEKTCKIFKDRMEKAEIENAILNEKLKNVTENKQASLSNLDLLKRISLLEQALYKLGKDPNQIR